MVFGTTKAIILQLLRYSFVFHFLLLLLHHHHRLLRFNNNMFCIICFLFGSFILFVSDLNVEALFIVEEKIINWNLIIYNPHAIWGTLTHKMHLKSLQFFSWSCWLKCTFISYRFILYVLWFIFVVVLSFY